MGKNERTLAHQAKLRESQNSNNSVKTAINIDKSDKNVIKVEQTGNISVSSINMDLHGNTEIVESIPFPKYESKLPPSKCKPCAAQKKLEAYAKKNKGVRVRKQIVNRNIVDEILK